MDSPPGADRTAIAISGRSYKTLLFGYITIYLKIILELHYVAY